jgi:hypothetical protein
MGEKEGTIYIFKTHPPVKQGCTPILFTHKDLPEAPAAVIISHPPPLHYSWRGTAADVKGGFLVLHTIYSENRLKR